MPTIKINKEKLLKGISIRKEGLRRLSPPDCQNCLSCCTNCCKCPSECSTTCPACYKVTMSGIVSNGYGCCCEAMNTSQTCYRTKIPPYTSPDGLSTSGGCIWLPSYSIFCDAYGDSGTSCNFAIQCFNNTSCLGTWQVITDGSGSHFEAVPASSLWFASLVNTENGGCTELCPENTTGSKLGKITTCPPYGEYQLCTGMIQYPNPPWPVGANKPYWTNVCGAVTISVSGC